MVFWTFPLTGSIEWNTVSAYRKCETREEDDSVTQHAAMAQQEPARAHQAPERGAILDADAEVPDLLPPGHRERSRLAGPPARPGSGPAGGRRRPPSRGASAPTPHATGRARASAPASGTRAGAPVAGKAAAPVTGRAAAPSSPAHPVLPALATGDVLSERDLRELERDFPDGLTSVQIVDVFTRRGLRFSEATFRKYVQQGLLPRSRRVGRKGKHQGSLGLYPASTVRRINVIKGLQAENYTIEEIQRQFLRFVDDFELVERGLRGLFEGFDAELARPHFDPGQKKLLKKDLSDAHLAAEELIKQLASIERRVVTPIERPPGGGAPGGAEDLL
jgi:hypothetical protein